MTLGSKSGGKSSRKQVSSKSTTHSQLSLRATKAYISSGKGSISGSSSSHHVQHTFSTTTGTRLSNIKETLTSSEIHSRNTKDYKEYQERLDSMTTTERSNIEALHLGGIQVCDDDYGHPAVDIMDILSGGDSMDISHVGGEFADLLAIGDDLLGPAWYVFILILLLKLIVMSSRPRVHDRRTRRNRTQRRTEAFSHQLPSLVRTYMDWTVAMGDAGLAGEYVLPPDADIQSTDQITVIDILSM